MNWHLEVNGSDAKGRGSLVHTTANFFGTWPDGKIKRSDAALRESSPWRNRPKGEMRAASELDVPWGGKGEHDVVWQDELWWQIWSKHADERLGWSADWMGLNPFDPPEGTDDAILREIDDKRWAALHPVSDEPEETGEEPSLDLAFWKMAGASTSERRGTSRR
jgi:hypothetical protein